MFRVVVGEGVVVGVVEGADDLGGLGHGEHEANWPVSSFGEQTSKGTCASPHLYAQQGS